MNCCRPSCGGLLLALCLVVCVPANASPIISEFLADNDGSTRDADGERHDWIEIRNTSSSPVNLSSYALTDDPAIPDKWVFPNQTLAGNAYLLIFASGKDRRFPGAELHTNFSLNSAGEYLALFESGNPMPLSEFDTYPPQFPDISYGEGATVTTETVVTSGVNARWLVPSSAVTGWNERAFSDAFWRVGRTGVGYERSSSNTYDPLIGSGADTEAQMYNSRTSCYIRIPFNLTNPADVSSVTLRIRYDDGFVAYINGQFIESDRAPSNPTWSSVATAIHDDSDAVVFTNFEIANLPTNLVPGSNVLAIQGLNRSTTSSDFLILPELDVTTAQLEPEDIGFHTELTPGAVNTESFGGLVADTKFSVDRGFFTLSFQVEITTATEGAQIRYTTDGSEPTATHGSIYLSPINIGSTTVLRAAAFKEGLAPTNIDTQTYIFTNSVRSQSTMDPDITNSPTYSSLMDTALRGNIPIVSLATPNDGFFGSSGIYTQFDNSGRAAEVPVSMEYFTPSGSEQFQIDAGIRIHGGNARSHPKKPMRLYFRRDYGEAKLRHPLFEGSPVDSFDQLLLRGGGHDSWSLAATFGRDDTDLPPHGTIMRDQFLRKCEVEMGILSPRGKYVHLYINGRYWGVYDLHERANEDFYADHGGGEPEDYDVLHHPEFVGQDYALVSGSDTAWNTMMGLATAGINNEAQYQAIQEYLDIDDYIVAMIVRMWSGDYDWCGPIYIGGANRTVFDNKNWYAGRRSRNGDGKFRFFTWDAEMSMGLHLMFNLGLNLPQRVNNFDLTRANDSGSPAALYDRLRNYLEFRVRFGDLLQKHLSNEGAMSTSNNLVRFAAMEDEIEDAMIAESARWGDEGFGGDVFDRNDEWRSEVNWLKNNFIPTRNSLLISQFRSRGLFSNLNAPIFSQRSGEMPPGSTITLSGSGGAIYYTLDGSDPRLVGGGVSPSAMIYTGSPIQLQAPSTTIRARVRVSNTNWSALDESTYIIGQAASASNLAITEFHYHPANPTTPAELAVSADDTDFEFIEITNTSDGPVILTDIDFDQGIGFTFDETAPFQEIAAGGRFLVVRNRDAFLARYGQSLAPLIAGIYPDSKLSNNGEAITLFDAFDQVISTFAYDDSSPWPTSPDGDGPSMVLREPVDTIDPALPTSWRASVIPGGTPGAPPVTDFGSWTLAFFDPDDPDFDIISAPDADPDEDGLSNVVEYALGRIPTFPEPRQPAVPSLVNTFLRDFPGITYYFQPDSDDVTIAVEISTDLIHWTTDDIVRFGSPEPQVDGTSKVTYRSTLEYDPAKPPFFRLRVQTTAP